MVSKDLDGSQRISRKEYQRISNQIIGKDIRGSPRIGMSKDIRLSKGSQRSFKVRISMDHGSRRICKVLRISKDLHGNYHPPAPLSTRLLFCGGQIQAVSQDLMASCSLHVLGPHNNLRRMK